MNLNGIAEVLNLALTLLLIVRLLALRLHSVYSVFCAYLIWAFLGNVVTFAEAYADTRKAWAPDYVTTWICYEIVAWGFYLWIVHSLLRAILANLPGILRISKVVLQRTFIIALVLGLLSATPEYNLGGLGGLYGVVLVLDRVICTVALVVLVVVLGGILWFPVEISRNLAIFSGGFLIYFAVKTSLLLTRSLISHESFDLVSTVMNLISSACFVYWVVFITASGEAVPVRLGRFLGAKDRDAVTDRLQALNASLLRTNERTR